MLLYNDSIKTTSNCPIQMKSFKIEESPIAFEILSSRLYANPVLAIVRELITNAYDSHKLANKLEVPVKIHFPDYLDKNFIIRDFGTGLSKEDIMDLYTTFFSSTKSTSNDFTGCFGLGSKTPFSYTSAFSVNSYFNGIKYYYAIVKKDGYPNIINVKEEITDEPNGLEVIIPTDNDINFFKEAKKYLRYMPEILIDSNKEITRDFIVYKEDFLNVYKGIVHSEEYFTNNIFDNILIKQGQNIYTINEFISTLENIHNLNNILVNNSIIIEVPIGTLSITPSREALSKEESNIETITNYILKAESIIEKLFEEKKNDIIKHLDVNLYLKLLTEKYFKDEQVKFDMNYYSTYNEISLDISCIYADKYNVLGRNRTSIIDTDTKTIVLSTDIMDNKNIQKIKRTLINHNEKIDNFLMVYPHRGESLLKFARRIKNIINTLNNMSEYSFNIELITINKFFKLYPNSKIKREKNNTDSYHKNIYLQNYVLNLSNILDSFFICNKYTNTINNILSSFNKDNTIIMEKNNSICHNIRFITLVLSKIRNNNKENFLLDYFKSKGLKINMSNDNINFTELNFVIVAKSNLNIFKKEGYFIFNKEKCLNFIKNNDWNVSYIDTSKTTEIIKFLECLESSFRFNFKNKSKNIILSSKLYKNILFLKDYYKNKSNTFMYNYIKSEYSKDLIKRMGFKDRIISNSDSFWLPKNIKNIFKDRSNFILKLFITFDENKNKIYTYAFNSKQKDKIFRIIKGEKKNVLF